MSNIWDHPDVIAQESLGHLESALVIGNLCARDLTSDFTTRSMGWKVGDEVSYRTHGEYVTKEFTGTIEPQQISGSTRTLKIEKFFDTSVEITAREETLDLDSLSEQFLKPAMYKFAETIDQYLGTKLLQAQGLYVSDALFESAADIALARKAAILQQLTTNRYALVDLDIEALLLGQTWFNQASARGTDGETTLRNAVMGRTMAMNFDSSISFPTNAIAHTAAIGTAITNNGTAVLGIFPNNKIGDSVLTIDGGSAINTFGANDRLKVAGVKRPLVVKTTTAALDGVTSVELTHPITEVIPDNAAITVIGAGQDLVYHGVIMDDRSLGVAFPMLDKPGDKVSAIASSHGINLRIVKGYSMEHKVNTVSIDMLCGAFMLDTRRVTLLAGY